MEQAEKIAGMKDAVIITGASGSMGSAATYAMAEKGFCVIMACRNQKKGDLVKQDILHRIPTADLRLIPLDIASKESIRSFISRIAGLDDLRIMSLFNNAGIINRNFLRTADGFENTVATNYLGPYMLTLSLLPFIEDGGNIVNMVSLTCNTAEIDRYFFKKGETDFSQLGTYGNTKLALMLFSVYLSEHITDISGKTLHVNVADPGIVDSNMISMHRWFDPLADIFFRPFFCSRPEKGVSPAIRALTCQENGMLFKGKGQKPIPKRYHAHKLKEWLWFETAAIIEAV